MARADNKTKPTGVEVARFLDTLQDGQKRSDSEALIAMMRDVTGHEPIMWGPSIIGFDTYHYTSEAGREGDICATGFSPRKTSLTIYIYEGFNDHGDLLEKLGPHSIGMGCLYIKRLSDIDLGVLRELIKRSYSKIKAQKPNILSVEEYESHVPAAARDKFIELRSLVREILPKAEEVISYGIPAYKIDAKRAVVYISAWKDHVAVYPVPHDNHLRAQLKPYIKGKGTLWFGLDQPLPKPLIRQAVHALVADRR